MATNNKTKRVLARLTIFTGALLLLIYGALSYYRYGCCAFLVANGAQVTKLAGGFSFTEGPARHPDGSVYFSDIPNDRIYRWSEQDKLTVAHETQTRPNGLYFDRDGNLIVCEPYRRRIVSFAPDGRVTVLANEYQNKPLNSPNDLWVDPAGGIYFSDPRIKDSPIDQDGYHVYYLTPDKRDVRRVIDNLVKPNGIVGTADGTRLFVADPDANKTYVYDIVGPGKLSSPRIFARIGSDGLTLDERGNLYLTQWQAVRVYNPWGLRIASIWLPESPSNMTFAGRDNRTLYITAVKGLYALKMRVRGQPAAWPERALLTPVPKRSPNNPSQAVESNRAVHHER